MSEQGTGGTPPIKVFKDYPMEAAIWRKENRDGERFYTVSLTRTYTKPDPDTGAKSYHRTTQLNKRDLLVSVELLRQAYHQIARYEQIDRE